MAKKVKGIFDGQYDGPDPILDEYLQKIRNLSEGDINPDKKMEVIYGDFLRIININAKEYLGAFPDIMDALSEHGIEYAADYAYWVALASAHSKIKTKAMSECLSCIELMWVRHSDQTMAYIQALYNRCEQPELVYLSPEEQREVTFTNTKFIKEILECKERGLKESDSNHKRKRFEFWFR